MPLLPGSALAVGTGRPCRGRQTGTGQQRAPRGQAWRPRGRVLRCGALRGARDLERALGSRVTPGSPGSCRPTGGAQLWDRQWPLLCGQRAAHGLLSPRDESVSQMDDRAAGWSPRAGGGSDYVITGSRGRAGPTFTRTRGPACRAGPSPGQGGAALRGLECQPRPTCPQGATSSCPALWSSGPTCLLPSQFCSGLSGVARGRCDLLCSLCSSPDGLTSFLPPSVTPTPHKGPGASPLTAIPEQQGLQ